MSIILDILFPKKCVGCKKEGSYFCQDCISNIKQADLVCPKCERLAAGGQTHPICRRKFALDGLWSLGVYEDPLKKAIQQLKYKGVKELSEILSDIFIEYWAKYQPFILDQMKKDLGNGWAIIPIPLHWFRVNSRGFNQSSLIGQSLSKKLGLDYMDGLKRIRYTKPQVGLKGNDRHQNIRGAFALSENWKSHTDPSGLEIENCLLIDDVWTTGSTIKECCYILKRNGVKKVWAITLAR